jgi:hypothetical protein
VTIADKKPFQASVTHIIAQYEKEIGNNLVA